MNQREQPRRLRIPSPGLWLLAALAYLPALSAAPGRMPTDTKLYLYLDPGRLMADAPLTWDVRQFGGWVPHQIIAYLWPSGPWFWLCETIGLPDWIAHRLWIGTLLFAGGAGVRWAARHLGLTGAAATVAGLVYATSPYILPYISRTSVMLLPWAGLGWLVGLTIRVALGRTRWRDVGLFGLVVLTIGAVNAAALALVAPAPVLWLLHAAWARSITWRTAAVTALKLGAISLLVSLWWIVMVIVQGRHGADVLRFSETLDAVSLTSVSTETLRGLGYWLFYVRDPYAFTTTASLDYMASTKVIAVGFALLVICLLGLATVTWASRRFAALLVFSGIVLAVGVHPIDDPSPIMAPLADSALGLALRSSTRALPLSTMGLALGAGALVAVAGALRPRARQATAMIIVALAVLNLPALWTGGFVDPALERDQDVPRAWADAVDELDAGSLEHRVIQLPGSEFGAFRWGYTVDPPLPGLTDKPLLTRDLLPLGSPGAMDLLFALDNRVQTGTIDPRSLAPLARLMAADTIWLANDLAFERFRTPRPEIFADLFATGVPGLGSPRSFGDPVVNVPDIAMVDEQSLTDERIGSPFAPVQLVGVEDPVAVVRASNNVVIVAGSGDGLVDAAAAGVLTGHEVVLYAADLATTGSVPDGSIPSTAPLVITDSHRDRAFHWRSSQDVSGLTEVGGPGTDVMRGTSADQRLAVFAVEDEAQQTVARLDGGLVVRATSYGEPFAYRPEDRPAMAVDGNPSTAWRVADRADPVGETIEVSSTDGRLILLQQQRADANRQISEVSIRTASGVQLVSLGAPSTVPPGQVVDVPPDQPVSVTITAVAPRPEGTDSGPSAVGFAELGPVAVEVVRVPTGPLEQWSEGRPLAIVLTRERVRSSNRWRSDPEPTLVRQLDLPEARAFDARVTLRMDDRASDDLVAALGGLSEVATANRRLTGHPESGGFAALDGDPTTTWTTPFGEAVGATLRIPVVGALSGPLVIQQPVDELHSPITRITLRLGDDQRTLAVPEPGLDGRSTIDPGPMRSTSAPGGSILELRIDDVQPATTLDRRYAEKVVLPAAVTEIDGIQRADARRTAIATCQTGLLRIDGRPVGLRFGEEIAERLRNGEAVDVPLCGEAVEVLTLEQGSHRVESVDGSRTGIDVDQIVLRSVDTDEAESGGGTSAASGTTTGPVGVRIERSRTTRTADVEACPTGCWLILGEGYNPAWSATTADGVSLGPPRQVSGGFNGWWLEPSDTEQTVVMTWTPQRSLDVALLVAATGVLACLALALSDRRVRRSTFVVPPPRLALVPAAVDRQRARVGAVALVVAAALFIAPAWALIALVPAVLYATFRRPAALVLAAAAGAAMIGLLVIARQYRFRYFPDAAWPGNFEDVHGVGLFIVILVVVGGLVGDQDKATDTSDGPRNEALTQ